VLIQGETGTGKELIARAIHVESGRPDWVARNCAEMQPALAESTLFGHERGSFTGADRKQLGAFELADNGTLFLDEIGDLPLLVQAKLLRVLEERLFRAVGAARERGTSARVVAATHTDLRSRVREGRVRADLLYRLDVVSIRMPPLRERSTDIPELVAWFASAHPSKTFSADAIRWLQARTWRGNVRELRHMVDRAALLVRSESIGVDDLISLAARTNGSDSNNCTEMPRDPESIADDILAMETTGSRLAVVESALVKKAIARTNGNVAAAARQTGHNRTTFLRRLLGIKKTSEETD
jgi:transcriptional regulator with GAF, ATPase, and Fis domain